MLAGAAEEPDAEPGLGEVGGLVAVLLASLEKTETNSDYSKRKDVARKTERSLNPLDRFHVTIFNLGGDLRNFLSITFKADQSDVLHKPARSSCIAML